MTAFDCFALTDQFGVPRALANIDSGEERLIARAPRGTQATEREKYLRGLLELWDQTEYAYQC